MNLKNQKKINSYTRRVFVRIFVVILGSFFYCATRLNVAAQSLSSNTQKYSVIGKIRPITSREIKSSALGVGFETLDRKLFDPQKCYKQLGELGIKWARCQTGWNRCEQVKGVYDFKWLDDVVDNLLAVGIQPWFNVGYGNKMYTPGAENNSAVGWIPMNTEDAMIGWENFVQALSFHFKGRVKHFELWNEPNVTPFWRPGKLTPEVYVEFIKRSKQAIHSQMPDAIIIGGGFGGFPTDFLTKSLEIGLGKHIDKLSFHPYTLFPEKNSKEKEYKDDVGDWKKLVIGYNPEITLWQGECGCPSTDNSVGALCNYKWNESRQARWLLRRLINDLRLDLEMISWYHTCDQGRYGKAVYEPNKKVNAYFGLLRLDDYSPKPSYYAFQNMCALFDSETKVNSAIDFKLPKDSGDMHVEQAIFSRNSYPVCSYWMRSDVQQDVDVQSIEAFIHCPSDLILKNPVLIDPMSGEVLKPKGIKTDNGWYFSILPLKDYPMLITDFAAFKISKLDKNK